uniref:Uncharacterized protein n=1 Tax=Arundo donax TaxID=35708 RepID=A0A0A9FQD3_ARUDO
MPNDLNSVNWELLDYFAEAGNGLICDPTSCCNHSTMCMSSHQVGFTAIL